ncbi:hypothetical protein LTR95_006836 [Oleoguttula sp. CCFEE 5521]
MSSVAIVFGAAELLEQILIHTTMQEVLLLQRVSKTFKHVIATSPPLQQKLFFKATRLTKAGGPHPRPQPNTLLLSALGGRYSTTEPWPTWDARGQTALEAQIDHFLSMDFTQPYSGKEMKPGSCQKMLVLQPPVHGRMATVGLCINRDPSRRAWRLLENLVARTAMVSRALDRGGYRNAERKAGVGGGKPRHSF